MHFCASIKKGWKKYKSETFFVSDLKIKTKTLQRQTKAFKNKKLSKSNNKTKKKEKITFGFEKNNYKKAQNN